MSLLVVGINHKTASLKVRERISFTRRKLKETLGELKKIPPVLGIVILSTCNRTEIYAHLEEKENDKEQILKFLLQSHQITEEEFNRYSYILEDIDGIRHLFRVASGLDSQVLGETQILGQVKSSWRMSKDLEVTSKLLEGLFEKAVEVGKIVRTKTKISQGNVSIGTVAIKMLEQRFKDLGDKTILIIGAGKIGTLVSKYIKEKGTRGIFVSNRTYEKARQLASDCGGEAINFKRLKEKLKTVDIVISSTASPHLVLKKDTLAEVMQERKEPLLIMDIALPRDVDPEARKIRNIFLYDLDDLKSVVEENFARRKEEAKLAEAIIQRELNRFLDAKWKILCRQERPLELAQGRAL